MKICKKIVLLLIIFVLSSTLNVFADNGATNAEVRFTTTTKELKVGETVEITLVAKCETGISGLDSTLSWDKTKLELTNQSQLESTTMSGVDESTGKFKLSVFASTETSDEVELVKVSFKVLETATPGEELNIALSDIELYDNNVDTVNIEDKTVTLTVADKETPKDDDEENPPKDDDEETPSKDDDEEQQKDDDKKKEDTTEADKEINHAGIEEVIPIVIVAIALVTIALYVKSKKYNGIN